MRHILLLRHCALAASLSLLLAACGGGGGGGGPSVSDIPWPVDPGTARSLTGGSVPPNMTSNQIEARLEELTGAANSLLLSDVLLFTDAGSSSRIDVSCGVTTCQSTYLGETETISLSDLSDDIQDDSVGGYQAVMTRNGVTLAQGRGRGHVEIADEDETVTTIGYGGWLDYSYFAVEASVFNESEVGYIGTYSIGDATGTNPVEADGSGTWSGVMVGGDVSATASRGHVIQGDADITIADFSDPKVGVAFTNIHDLDAGTQRADMTWSDIAVTAGGFQTGSDGNSVEGRFYGPKHEEVGGIFERDQILGAFGATRQ